MDPTAITTPWQALVMMTMLIVPVLTTGLQAWMAAQLHSVHRAVNGGGLQQSADRAAVKSTSIEAKLDALVAMLSAQTKTPAGEPTGASEASDVRTDRSDGR